MERLLSPLFVLYLYFICNLFAIILNVWLGGFSICLGSLYICIYLLLQCLDLNLVISALEYSSSSSSSGLMLLRLRILINMFTGSW